MAKDLFFDDTKFFRCSGFKRTYTKPEIAGTFIDGDRNTVLPGGWVLKQPDGTFRMIYAGTDFNGESIHILTAISYDGIHFLKDMTAAASNGIEDAATANQLMMDFPENSEIVTVFEDPYAAPEARYKMLTAIYNPEELRLYNRLLISADTLHWQLVPTVLWHSRGSEPVGSCCYDSVRKRWFIATRPDWGDRRIAGIYTTDWETFTPPRLLLAPDSQDEELVEFYGLSAADCDGTIIGLLFRYNPGEKNSLGHKFFGGTITCELVYSRDGEYWQRTLRQPFAGEDKSMFFPVSILHNEQYTCIYGTYSELEHGGAFRAKELSSGIRIYRSVKDRFLALETTEDSAVLALRECVWHGGKLLWNLKAQHATLAIYDHTSEKKLIASHEDCIPFSGDDIAWEPHWKNRISLDDLTGKLLVFELKISNGSVWSVSGNYTLLHTTEAFRFQRFGTIPTRKCF